VTIRDMVARHSDFEDTRDFIPTPPYATRALYEFVWPSLKADAPRMSAWDPAAGRGHMLKVFHEYGHRSVLGTDIAPWPLAGVERANWLEDTATKRDLIVTNPPYALLRDFIIKGRERAREGLALLTRVQALETQGRFELVYRDNPPTQLAFFADRIPFKTGAVVRRAPKMFFHVWLYWDLTGKHSPKPPLWVPPNAQALLEKDEDYAA
jgi:hypothetical protein